MADDQYWVCAKCGKMVSPKPQKRRNRERREGGWDHRECSNASDTNGERQPRRGLDAEDRW